MKKALSVIETMLIAMIIVVVAITSLVIYNNLKLNLANGTKINLRSDSASSTSGSNTELSSTNTVTGSSIAKVSDAETAGSVSTLAYRTDETKTIVKSTESALKNNSSTETSIDLGTSTRIDISNAILNAILSSSSTKSINASVPSSLVELILKNMDPSIPQDEAYSLAQNHARELMDKLTSNTVSGNSALIASYQSSTGLSKTLIKIVLYTIIDLTYFVGVDNLTTTATSSDNLTTSTIKWSGSIF